ncbi:MAG: preprotein translocase subunit SecE [Candidatus Brennerbacteria bacterium]|nr:preprotein translocase subunit SecE [Candidatus Brennerbacteria bacterium]
MFGRIKSFFEESRRELKRVNWPSRKETVRYTLFVIGFSVVVAAFLGLLDFIFIQLLERLVL